MGPVKIAGGGLTLNVSSAPIPGSRLNRPLPRNEGETMRLPEAKIKQAILNPELDIRQRAMRYFSVCHSDDEGVVPLMIQAIEKYGREDAYHLVGSSVDLRQTEATVSWIIDELNDPDSDRYENYTFNLTRVLCHADPALLIHRDTAILESRHFFRDFREDFTRRLQPLSWDEAECWRRLEEICEAGKDKQYANEVDMSFANNILEAMARIGGTSADRVLAILSQKVDDFENNPMKWLEPLMVRFAGLLRLEAAVPLIVGKLHEDDDLLAESCIEALSRIASDTVVAAVAEDFADAKRHFRLYATDVLESVHSDLAVQKSLDLMARERDRHIQERLAHAALSHFARGSHRASTTIAQFQPNPWRSTPPAGLLGGHLHDHGGAIPRVRRVAGGGSPGT